MYEIAANLTLIVHFAFILFVVFDIHNDFDLLCWSSSLFFK